MIGALIFIFFIPYIIFSIVALLIMLSEKISRTSTIAKKNRIRYNQLEKQNMLHKENEQKEEKWKNDLRNGKQVQIGETLIQCENNTFIINGRRFLMNEIQELEFTYEVVGVLEKTIDSYISDKPLPVTHYEDDYGYVYSDWKDSFGKVTATERMTVEEYHKKLKGMFDFHEYGDENFFKNHQYEFEKEYYLSITLNNGQHITYLIGNGLSKSEKDGKEAEKLREMINQVKNYIFKSEEELQWINSLNNGKPVQIGEATIQSKNKTLIINEDSIFIKEIQSLEFADKVSYVWKNTIDINPYKNNDYSIPNPNWGKTIHREKITLEQYENEKKCIDEESLKYSYDIEKEYYISITLNKGQQKNYLIGNSIPHYEENEKLKEKLKEMINEVKCALKE